VGADLSPFPRSEAMDAGLTLLTPQRCSKCGTLYQEGSSVYSVRAKVHPPRLATQNRESWDLNLALAEASLEVICNRCAPPSMAEIVGE
jgi:hypothetical protein